MPNYPWKSGDHLVICDFCGFKYLRSECRMTWENWLVCKTCWEPRHPQDITPPSRVDRQWVEEPRDRKFINDFSGWFIQDANASITKTGDEFNAFFAVDGTWDVNQVYAYADYGADYFDGDWIFKTVVKIAAPGPTNLLNFFGVSAVVASANDFGTFNALGLTIALTAGDELFLVVRETNVGASYGTTVANLPPGLVNKDVGLAFERSGNNLLLSIFSDRFFTRPIKSQTIAMQGLTNIKYRYLFALNSAPAVTGNQELDLQFTKVELK